MAEKFPCEHSLMFDFFSHNTVHRNAKCQRTSLRKLCRITKSKRERSFYATSVDGGNPVPFIVVKGTGGRAHTR